MRKIYALVVLIAGLCTACASVPARFPGDYDRLNRVYANDTIGFRLIFPRYWAVAAKPRDFTVPVALRPDQERVLEAYDLASKLGLVVVVQEGPLLDIADLVQRMQEMPEAQVTEQLRSPQAAGIQQTIRHIMINGQAAAEWIYTATDTTGAQPVDMTVSSYILKVGEQYVYLTFSIATAQETASRPAIKSILNTFERFAPKIALQAT